MKYSIFDNETKTWLMREEQDSTVYAMLKVLKGETKATSKRKGFKGRYTVVGEECGVLAPVDDDMTGEEFMSYFENDEL